MFDTAAQCARPSRMCAFIAISAAIEGAEEGTGRGMTQPLHDAVVAALDRVIDPCSVGRGVPAGLNDMGMVKSVEVDPEAGTASVTLQLTSPACHFQLWFFERVREEVAEVSGVGDCTVEFSKDYDWSDDEMSEALKQRLQDRRRALTLMPVRSATG